MILLHKEDKTTEVNFCRGRVHSVVKLCRVIEATIVTEILP